MTEQNEMPDVIWTMPGCEAWSDENLTGDLVSYTKTSTIGAGIDRGELHAELDYYDLFKETQMYKAAAHLLELMDKGE